MKLIEKMATEYHARNSDRLWLVDDERVWLRQVVEACWQDGFRAAKEFALKRIYQNCHKLGCACKHVEYLESLGESEVKL